MVDRFSLLITTENAAFFNPDDEADFEPTRDEVVRILKDAIEKLENGRDSATLLDINGNRVGSYSFD